MEFYIPFKTNFCSKSIGINFVRYYLLFFFSKKVEDGEELENSIK